MDDNQAGSDSADRKACSCPFCDAAVEKLYPFCKDCGKILGHCKVCGRPIPPHRDTCAECQD